VAFAYLLQLRSESKLKSPSKAAWADDLRAPACVACRVEEERHTTWSMKMKVAEVTNLQ
jgi:hypothetical protein